MKSVQHEYQSLPITNTRNKWSFNYEFNGTQFWVSFWNTSSTNSIHTVAMGYTSPELIWILLILIFQKFNENNLILFTNDT